MLVGCVRQRQAGRARRARPERVGQAQSVGDLPVDLYKREQGILLHPLEGADPQSQLQPGMELTGYAQHRAVGEGVPPAGTRFAGKLYLGRERQFPVVLRLVSDKCAQARPVNILPGAAAQQIRRPGKVVVLEVVTQAQPQTEPFIDLLPGACVEEDPRYAQVPAPVQIGLELLERRRRQGQAEAPPGRTPAVLAMGARKTAEGGEASCE